MKDRPQGHLHAVVVDDDDDDDFEWPPAGSIPGALELGLLSYWHPYIYRAIGKLPSTYQSGLDLAAPIDIAWLIPDSWEADGISLNLVAPLSSAEIREISVELDSSLAKGRLQYPAAMAKAFARSESPFVAGDILELIQKHTPGEVSKHHLASWPLIIGCYVRIILERIYGHQEQIVEALNHDHEKIPVAVRVHLSKTLGHASMLCGVARAMALSESRYAGLEEAIRQNTVSERQKAISRAGGQGRKAKYEPVREYVIAAYRSHHQHKPNTQAARDILAQSPSHVRQLLDELGMPDPEERFARWIGEHKRSQK